MGIHSHGRGLRVPSQDRRRQPEWLRCARRICDVIRAVVKIHNEIISLYSDDCVKKLAHRTGQWQSRATTNMGRRNARCTPNHCFPAPRCSACTRTDA
ncbi:hypothetical protein G6F32_015401 [Rhizopus arrhizus]|nr:hypothetical protein G6F32_015401 [Rhizopus arrhizus]